MYSDDDVYADDGYVELPPPPDNPRAGFWQLGALQLLLAGALAISMLVARSPRPEPALDELIVSSIEPASTEALVSGVDVSPTAVPIPRMRETAEVPAPGWVIASSAAPSEPRPRDFVIHAGRDLHGGDYDSFRNISHQECADRCKSDLRCRAYTYNTWEKACFVKSTLSALRIEPRGVTGVLASEKTREDKRPPVIQRTRSRLFPGVPYRQVLAPAYEGCAKACLDDAQCLGFNYGRGDRTCALMAALDKPVAAASTDLGIKSQRSESRTGRIPPGAYPDFPPELAILDAVQDFMRR